MTHLFKNMSTETAYIDKKPMLGMSEAEREAYEAKYRAGLRDSKTVYVGNLGFSVQEESVHALFSSVGTVRDIVMGLDRTRKTPCGFCFVEFATHDGAEDAIRYLNSRKLDKRPLRIDWDLGNVRQENRYWGRGASGGQVRDEYRLNFDPERGGVGSRVSRILGGGVVEVDEREYGAWAYTRFNAHDRRTTTKRQREEALSDARYEYNPDNKDGRKRARVDEDGDDA